MSSKLTIAIGGIALFGLGGCAAVDPGMGEALKYDMAAQTIDPDPTYGPDDAKPGDSGEHGADAAKRYRDGAVKEVQQIRTSNTSSGGGSGPQ